MASMYAAEPIIINQPAKADISQQASAIRQSGEVAANLGEVVKTVGSAALTGYGDILTKNAIEETSDVVARTRIAGAPSQVEKTQAALAGTSFDTEAPVNEQPSWYSKLLSNVGVIKAAEVQNVFSPDEATLRIAAIQKKYSAMYPGMGAKIRQGVASAVETGVYGGVDKQTYNLLHQQAQETQARKDAQKIELDYKEYASKTVPGALNESNEWASPEARDRSIKSYQIFNQAQASATVAKNALEEKLAVHNAGEIDVKSAYDANKAVTNVGLYNAITTAGAQLSSLIPSAQAIVDEATITRGVTEAINQNKVAQLAQLNTMQAKFPQYAALWDKERATLESETEIQLKIYANPRIVDMMSKSATADKMQSDMWTSMARAAGGLSYLFNDPVMQQNAAFKIDALAKKGIDIFSPDSKLTSEQIAERDKALREVNIGPASLDLLRNVHTNGVEAVKKYTSAESGRKTHDATGNLLPYKELEIAATAGDKGASVLLEGLKTEPLPQAGESLTPNKANAITYRATLYNEDSIKYTKPEQTMALVSMVRKDSQFLKEITAKDPMAGKVLKNNYVSALLNGLTTQTTTGTTAASPMAFFMANPDVAVERDPQTGLFHITTVSLSGGKYKQAAANLQAINATISLLHNMEVPVHPSLKTLADINKALSPEEKPTTAAVKPSYKAGAPASSHLMQKIISGSEGFPKVSPEKQAERDAIATSLRQGEGVSEEDIRAIEKELGLKDKTGAPVLSGTSRNILIREWELMTGKKWAAR